jgi:hypothetical protein
MPFLAHLTDVLVICFTTLKHIIVMFLNCFRFNDSCEEFGFFLFDVIQQLNLHKKKENQAPYEIDYQFVFEKFLRVFEIRAL